MKKIYKCCICHKILEDYKPIRIAIKKYGIGNYHQYKTTKNYDYCIKCFAMINDLLFKWIK